jgi:hypothetical protein
MAITSPPFIFTRAAFIKASAATFSPTCFVVTSERLPVKDTPKAASSEVFSFAHHLAIGPPLLNSFIRYCKISEDGVPGYP